jgi:biopolymer transport protein ExbD
MKKRFSRSKKIEPIDLDITSLLDILVIMLVFLLKNYNASELTLDLVKNVKAADSESRLLGHNAPIVQISASGEIYLENKLLGHLKENGLSLLEAKLQEVKDRIPASVIEAEKLKDKEAKKTNMINLVFDKDLPYESVDAIMSSSARVGFNQFKFIVKGNY